MGHPEISAFPDKIQIKPGFAWDDALKSAADDSALLLPILLPKRLLPKRSQHLYRRLRSPIRRATPHPPRPFTFSAPKDHALAALQATNFYSEGPDKNPIEFPPGTPQYHQGIQNLVPPKLAEASVTGLAWNPDGKTLASASADTTIKLWPATFQGLLDQARHSIRLFSLPEPECQRYFQKSSCPPLR